MEFELKTDPIACALAMITLDTEWPSILDRDGCAWCGLLCVMLWDLILPFLTTGQHSTRGGPHAPYLATMVPKPIFIHKRTKDFIATLQSTKSWVNLSPLFPTASYSVCNSLLTC